MDEDSIAHSQPRGGHLGTLLRLLLLKNAYGVPPAATPSLLFTLVLLCLASWAGVDWLENQPDPQFYWYGVPGIAWYVLGVLSISTVIARSSAPKLMFEVGVLIVLLPTPFALVLGYVVDTHLLWPWNAFVGVAGCGYFIAYLYRALRSVTGARQIGAATLGAWAVFALIAVTRGLYAQPTVWYADQAEDATAYEESRDAAEALLFSQAARIDAALAALEPQNSDSPRAFFLGFAGYGEQKVFAEEIKLASRVIAERYGTAGRGVLLLNDQRDLEQAPLATGTALRYTLRGLAAKMNLDRDVLFLSLSSHGSEDWAVSVSNGALPLNDLGVQELATMLRDAGIKWRVIVVSACYSGGFIEPLRDDHTVVITAAAADRTSFGCSDERDLTYFGEAFYRDALPKSASLRQAFNDARLAIAAREQREGIDPSRPQAHFGMQIEERLRQMASSGTRRVQHDVPMEAHEAM